MPVKVQRMDEALRGDPRRTVPILADVLGGPVHIPGPVLDLGLYRVYCLCEEQKIDQALDEVFERIDGLLSASRFEECDRLLDQVDVNRLNSHLLVGFLTITAAARHKLTARERLYTRVAQALRRLKGEQYAAQLLSRLT
jgi:hypothetical protein